MLRLVVLTCELWLGAGFLLVLVSVLRLQPTWLAHGMVMAGALALLTLAVLDPERFVAEQNVTRFEQTGKVDAEYLAELSTDAVPALVQLPEPTRTCVLMRIALNHGPPEDDWRSVNSARAAAEPVLAGLRANGRARSIADPIDPAMPCDI